MTDDSDNKDISQTPAVPDAMPADSTGQAAAQNLETDINSPLDEADEALSPPPAPDVSLDDMLRRQARKSPKIQLRDRDAKLFKYGMIGAAVLFLALIVYSCQPAKGSMAYGICSTYLQMNTDYPYTLRYTGLEESNTAVRIYFTSIDPFGTYKQETIECKFGPGPGGGARVTTILRNRNAVDAQIVRDFNKVLPTIVASNPNLAMPPNRMNYRMDDYWRLHEHDDEIFRPMTQP